MHQQLVYEEQRDGFDIKLYLCEEYCHPNDVMDYESKEEQENLLNDIENGNILYFTAKVTASKNGIELASDFLGCCMYKSVKEFIEGDYYADMAVTAINEAKENIKNLLDKLK